MINEAPKSRTRPILIFNYVLLLHIIFLLIFFIKLVDTSIGRKLQALVQKVTSSKPKITTPLQPPNQKLNNITQVQLEKLKPEQEQHELEAANKVKPITNEKLYFISHIVDMSDKPVENPVTKSTITKSTATQATQQNIAQQDSASQPSSTIKQALELVNTYLPEINSSNQTLATQTTVHTVPIKPNPSEIKQQYNNHELTQLQKDLEIQADLLEQQAKLNSQKYKINKSELKKVKFSLDSNHSTDQELSSSDREKLDLDTIKLPDSTNNNSQDQNNNSLNIGDHSNGPGSKPIIRALAPSAYLRFANANGQNIMSQAGRKSGQPTIQDLRKLSYNAMVMRTFSDAFNAFKLIFNLFINEHTIIYVRFIIDPTGQVVHIDTHSDNAPPNVLEFIRKAIAYANPFPPLPKHLTKDNYIFGPFAITFHPGRVAGQYVWTHSRSAK